MSGGLTARIVELLDARQPFCLATVVLTQGAVPCRVADKMIVRAGGEIEGSLGATTLDLAVARAAVDTLKTEVTAVVRVGADGRDLPARRSLRLAGDDAFVEVAIEPMMPTPHLIIVGAGHIAVPLARYAKVLDFKVTVIDDRERFASRERFPDADEIVVDDFERAIVAQTITPWTYLTLLTRGHEHDEATLQHVVGSPAPYIGMIGSRRRVLLVFQRLTREGVSDAFLDRIYAPIGLDIGSRTPEEIALAIMAEIVNVRRGGHAPSLALRQRMKREGATMAASPTA